MFRLPCCLAALAAATAFAQPPAAPKKPVTDVYHGVQVTDDYRWLENYSDPAVHAWSDAENKYARKYLDSLPLRATFAAELKRLADHPTLRYFGLTMRQGVLFGLKAQPPAEQPLLVTLKSADQPDSERAVLDPNKLDPTGGTSMDFYVPSTDAKYVAVSLAKGGSESGDVHVYEVATGKEIAAPIPRVNGGTAGGSVAWNADSTGFYYTRYPRPGERPAADLDFYQQVYFHRLGADTRQDQYSIGKEFPRIAEIQLRASDDGRYILASMANGDGGEFAHYLLGPSGQWHQIARLSDEISSVKFSPEGGLYMLSHLSASKGKILKSSIAKPLVSDAQIAVPESKSAIAGFEPAANVLYIKDSTARLQPG